ncbi:hypothetical protein PV569_33575 [Streptomyces scabiei]|uniref:hypothetical protein n=1 Tax=Streptomyces scabiei TaxID=1930 RepID=UPI0029A4DBB7|nr:hypothetical protein [Streptomyces scabiei]MDX3298594.1 hypothetical protein [Streptomyces scabiei]
MSVTEKVNEELPDGEALAGFAAGALGGGARARRRQQANAVAAPAKTPEAEPTSTPEPEPADKPTPPPAPPTATTQEPDRDAAAAARLATTPTPSEPVPVEPEPTSEPAVGEGEATVPRQSAVPDRTADTEPESEPADTKPEPTVTTAVEVRPASVAVTRTSPAPPRLQGGVVHVQVPDLGPSGARPTQCTVMLSHNVRDRFARYQLEKKMAGEKEPANALVVRRAFLSAKRNNLFGEILAEMYHRANAVDEEDYDEDGLLGEVVGRRPVRGRLRESGQQSFRPSEQELATYDAFSTAYGFLDRSAFMEGLLDRFLPQLPAAGRRR